MNTAASSRIVPRHTCAGSRGVRREGSRRCLREHAGHRPADRAARQGRHPRVRRELRAQRVEDPEFAPQVNAVLDAGNPPAARGRVRLPQRLPHLIDVGRRQLAGPRHVAVRPVDRQPAALRQPRRQRPADPQRRVPARAAGGPSPSCRRHHGPGRRARSSARPGLRLPRTSATRARTSAGPPMPDQYTLSAFERTEHATPGRPPLMAEIP